MSAIITDKRPGLPTKTTLKQSYYSKNIITNSIHLIGSLLLIYSIFMSAFYEVMGAQQRCRRTALKKHSGVKLRSANKSKEPTLAGDSIIYTCETTKFTQSIRCLDNGQWAEYPICPDPTNNICPDLEPMLHGSFNASGPYKYNTVIAFKCDNEDINFTNTNINNSSTNLMLTTTTLDANINEVDAITTTTVAVPNPPKPVTISLSLPSNQSPTYLPRDQPSSQPIVRYNLTGARYLRCLASSEWSQPQPVCSPVIPEPRSNINLMLTSIFLILLPILILATIAQLVIRWRRKQQQRARWKQYFTDYKYRHSKTSITLGMRPQTSNTTIPVTDL